MSIQGVSTEITAMRTAANQATDCAQRLQAAVQRLNGEVHGTLSTWQGDAPTAYWPGHEVHVNNVTRLVRSLHTMSEGINTSGTRYDASDQDSRADQTQVTSASSGIALNTLL